MKWFKHFTNASSNNKLTKVRMRYGAEGYAIYWYCLELIAGDLGESEEITFELKHDAEVIGFNLKIDQLRVEEIMKYMVSIDLFGQTNGVVSCIKLAKYLDKKNTRNQSIHRIIDQSKAEEIDAEIVADKSPTVADKIGQIVTNPARREESRLEENKPFIDTNVSIVGNDQPVPSEQEKPLPPAEPIPEESIPDCPHQEIISLYAKRLPMGIQPKEWDGSRAAALKTRWREKKKRQSLDWWDKFFEYVSKSKFLTGQVTSKDRKTFEITLPWILKAENFNKIIDGVYH